MHSNKSIFTSIENAINRLSVLSGYVSGWIVFIMMILMTVAVFARRVFGYPLVFSDEYCSYGMVFCVFLGGAYTLKQDAHVRVDVVAMRLKPRVRAACWALTSAFSLIYGGVLTWQTAKMVLYHKEIGHTALSIMETPTWIPETMVPVGMAILTLQMGLSFANQVRSLLTREGDGAR
jgi:TRAP-type C4-dicarboxylate transport system permease small subunit